MGMFAQHLKRSGRASVSSQTKVKQDVDALCNKADRPLTPLKLNSSTSSPFLGSTQKKALWPRSWSRLKQQSKPSTTPKSRQLNPSAFFNDQDDMLPTSEEAWDIENDDEVALLGTPIPSFIEPLFSPSDEEAMFQVISPLSAGSCVSSRSSPSCSTQRSPVLSPTRSTEKSNPIWKRVALLKRTKSILKDKSISSNNKKNQKEEIEIQFECFFEEDDEDVENEFNFRTRKNKRDAKASSKASLFRRTTLMQSWWTQTVGTMKRGCRMPMRPERSQTPGTAPLGPSDDESQEHQVVFEHLCIQVATDHSHDYDDDSSSEEEDNRTIHHRNMFVEAPIQFHIPLIVEPSSWEENESLYHLHDFDTSDRDTSAACVALV